MVTIQSNIIVYSIVYSTYSRKLQSNINNVIIYKIQAKFKRINDDSCSETPPLGGWGAELFKN